MTGVIKMSQVQTSWTADNNYKKKLFYHNGIGFKEVRCRFTSEYEPPSPFIKSGINVNLQGSAGLVGKGTSYYTSTIQMLFYSKEDMATWLQYVGSRHKFYDEKGTIYIGVVTESPDIETIQQETKYLVSVTLTLIKKQDFQIEREHSFVDIDGHWAKEYINEMQRLGVINTSDGNGQGVMYFKPEEKGTRAHMTAFITRAYRHMDRILRGY